MKVVPVQWVVLSFNTFAENRVPTRLSIFTLYLQHHKMTTPRRILGDIDPNITSRSELSPYLRGVIAGRAQEGGQPTLIAKDLKVPKSPVFTAIRRDPIRNDGRSRPRSGMPHKYTERFKRSVIREVRQIPKISYAGIRAALQSEISDTTI